MRDSVDSLTILSAFCQVSQLIVTLENEPRPLFAPMRQRTLCAVLPAFFRIREVPSAVGSKRIEGTITEQAVEFVFIDVFVAGEVLARAVRKEPMTCGYRFRRAWNQTGRPLR